jgi:hypothetical protein
MDPTLDPYYAFRKDLERKYSWLFGVIAKTHDDLLVALRDLDNNEDPSGKILALKYNIKPSEEDYIGVKKYETYLKDRKKMEGILVEILGKISKWNTYFGITATYSA